MAATSGCGHRICCCARSGSTSAVRAFAAEQAARDGTIVAPGGAAAYLAGKPIGTLAGATDPALIDLLRRLGIRTLGAFAALLLLGPVTIQTFTLALLIGVISGTYSSIFNASQIVSLWQEVEDRLRGRSARRPQAARLSRSVTSSPAPPASSTASG